MGLSFRRAISLDGVLGGVTGLGVAEVPRPQPFSVVTRGGAEGEKRADKVLAAVNRAWENSG